MLPVAVTLLYVAIKILALWLDGSVVQIQLVLQFECPEPIILPNIDRRSSLSWCKKLPKLQFGTFWFTPVLRALCRCNLLASIYSNSLPYGHLRSCWTTYELFDARSTRLKVQYLLNQLLKKTFHMNANYKSQVRYWNCVEGISIAEHRCWTYAQKKNFPLSNH